MEEETEVRPEKRLAAFLLPEVSKPTSREAACAAFEVEAVAVPLSRDVRAREFQTIQTHSVYIGTFSLISDSFRHFFSTVLSKLLNCIFGMLGFFNIGILIIFRLWKLYKFLF